MSGEASIPSASTEEPVRGSSETIIHTPSRRVSPFPHSRLSSVPNTENSRDASRGILKVRQASQNRAELDVRPVPGESNVASEPLPHRVLGPGPSISTHIRSEPFLGIGPKIQLDPGGLRDNEVIVRLRQTSAVQRKVQGPSKDGGEAAELIPQAAVILEVQPTTKKDTRWNHTPEGGVAPILQRRPEIACQENHHRLSKGDNKVVCGGTTEEDTTAFLPRSKSILFRRRPRIPQRLAPNRRAGDQDGKLPEKLIDLELESPAPRALQNNKPSDILGPSLLDDPVDEWADTLIQDIDTVSREAEDPCASILTTTTTGSDPGLPSRSWGDGASSDNVTTGGARANPTPASRVSDAPDPGNTTDGASPPSPPRAAPRDWPSGTDPPRETRTTATSSARQLTPTKRRTERLSPRASRHRVLPHDEDDHHHDEGQVPPPPLPAMTMTTIEAQQRQQLRPHTPPTSTCTCHHSPDCPQSSSNSSCAAAAAAMEPPPTELAEAMAQGAAQTAFRRRAAAACGQEETDDAPATTPHRHQQQPRPVAAAGAAVVGEPAVPLVHGQAGSGDIGDLSATARFGGGSNSYSSSTMVAARRAEVLHPAWWWRGRRAARRLALVLTRAARAYWLVIRPVFDATSPVRRRLDARRSTWADIGV